MTLGLPPYKFTRDSGLPWAPRIPEHWAIRRNGGLFSQRVETGFPDLPILEVSLRTGVRVRDMDNGKRKQVMRQREKYKRAAKGDIAYNMMRMWQGALGVAPVDGLISPAYVVARPYEGINSAYYSYLYRTDAYLREVNKFSRGIVADRNRLYWVGFKQMPALLPPPEEQDQIVAYLRAQDAKIADFIRDKRRVIELLNEQRQALIRQGVTCGFDANPRLKHSGVEWLGEVPEHWTRVHLGNVVQLINGFPFDAQRFNPDRGHPLIRIRDLYSKQTTVRYDGDEVVDAIVDTGDLLIGMDGDFNAALWQGGRALLNQRMCCIRSSKRLQTKYLALVLPLALKYINDLTLSTTVKHLSSIDLKRLRFPVPDVDEQREIVDTVADKAAPLDIAIRHERESVKFMLEFRDHLIADVVTGQMDVRSWAPGPGDVVDDTIAVLDDEDEAVMEEQGADDDDDGHE